MPLPFLLAASALGAPVDLSPFLDADLVEPAGNDAFCLKGPGRQTSRPAVNVPVGRAVESVTLTWRAETRALAGAGALVHLMFADGTSTSHRADLGVDMGPSPTGAGGPVLLGTRDGKPVVGSEWTVITGRPDTVLAEVRVAGKGPAICVTGIEAGAASRGAILRTDTTGWYPYAVAPTLPGPVPQLLPIEAPAGAHGKVSRGPDGHLRFADGTRARFWGADIYRSAAIPEKKDADALAATFAAWGFNMVRLHHIDDPGVGLVNPRRGEPGQPTIDPVMLDRLDFFLSRLKAHGVYFFLETATLRTFTAADGVGDVLGAPNGHKLLPMWRPEWLAAHLRWFEQLWGRTNPYTGLRYADDPMVAVTELSNEHSLLTYWGAGLEGLPSPHLAALDARWNAWLRTRYSDDAALAAAWGEGARAGLQGGESLASGTVRRDPTAQLFFPAWPVQRRRDLFTFYSSLERDYYSALATKARELGFSVPVVPTLGYGEPDVASLQTGFDLSDMHLEWDYAGGTDIRNESALTAPRSQNLLGRAGWAMDGLAMSISEVNHPFPNRFAAEAPLLWATYASVQDWDIVLWNSYSPSIEAQTWTDSGFDVHEEPTKLIQLATASSAFRTGAIPAATGRYFLTYTPEAVERAGIVQKPDLPSEVYDPGFFLGHRIRSRYADTPLPVVPGVPDPGVGWWADPGLLVLDRPMVQARVGPPAGGPLREGGGATKPGRLDVQLRNWAAVALAAVDGLPLTESRKAVLTVATRQENTGMAWEDHTRRVRAWGVAPTLMEPARGAVRLAWTGTPRVRVLGPDGVPGAEIPVRADGKGWWRIELDTVAAPWFLVETR